MKGETVIVRTLGGEPNILKVWEVGERAVFLCTPDNFDALTLGQQGVIPIGFPKYDVFEYDPEMAEKLIRRWRYDRGFWGQLKLWPGSSA